MSLLSLPLTSFLTAPLSASVGSRFAGIPEELPDPPPVDSAIPRAPARPLLLSPAECRQALANALRYFHPDLHAALAPEFARELQERGRIYMERFRPPEPIAALSIDQYPARLAAAAAMMLMIDNNLDPRVAQFPYELITYGGNGTVFQNWAQYLRTMQLLSRMTAEQSLHMYSGHPVGLFPSNPWAPRVVIANGMMIPHFSTPDEYTRLAALGVTMYGQMTAGSWMYIGPQGIVHGTTITLLNAARHYLGLNPEENLSGKLYVTSGLGGMSGAQAKAAVITGAVGLIAEINPAAAKKRHKQGWLNELYEDVDAAIDRALAAKGAGEAVSIGYVGNVVDLWQRLVDRGVTVELASDQTSLHNPYEGGYYPVGMSFDEANALMRADNPRFREKVHESLRRQVDLINQMSARGTHFWDYGNRFLQMAGEAGAEIFADNDPKRFRYPSYVEDLMGPLCFDYGFGPFRWVCTSNKPEDLRKTDQIAARVIRELAEQAPDEIKRQLKDNLIWIEQAEANQLVVGSQARILYSDLVGRREIALAFNEAIRRGEISGPIVLGRDHHDVSGTDSPYRETANIRDGSAPTADMAVQNLVGLAMRGASWVSIHNGGGVGWGLVMNGGFGLLLDGSREADRRIRETIQWDVSHGLARRAWAGNEGAQWAAERAEAEDDLMTLTRPQPSDPDLVSEAISRAGLDKI